MREKIQKRINNNIAEQVKLMLRELQRMVEEKVSQTDQKILVKETL